MRTDAFLSARGIQAFYGQSHVLRGVDFHVGRGESVALVGRNGMGKTTLIKTLLGLVRAKGGEIRVRGDDVTRAGTPDIVRRGIGYVPEGRGIFPNLSVRENLVMAARPGPDGRRDWDLARVLDAFPRLAERIGHGGGQLSGGEQQMLSIGRALMTNPDLLVLDEATEGLAPLIQREIWAIIGRIRRTGIASVIVDKDFRALSRLCDRTVVLVKGEVVYDGATGALAADPDFLHRHLGI
jgi:branched-chain amino acid transport system ATP-binding protein